MPSMEVWIEYASTYSYLTVARIGRLAAQFGVTLDWQPFFLPPVREHQGQVADLLLVHMVMIALAALVVVANPTDTGRAIDSRYL